MTIASINGVPMQGYTILKLSDIECPDGYEAVYLVGRIRVVPKVTVSAGGTSFTHTTPLPTSIGAGPSEHNPSAGTLVQVRV